MHAPASAVTLVTLSRIQIAAIVCTAKAMIPSRKKALICVFSPRVALYARARLPDGPRSASAGAQLQVYIVQMMTWMHASRQTIDEP